MAMKKRVIKQARLGVESTIDLVGNMSMLNATPTASGLIRNETTPVVSGLVHPINRRETGVVLVVSLIMLLLLTLIGLSGMQSTILEEKMAGNMRDRNMAFQAAEAALQDGERHIVSGSISGFTGFRSDCGAATANSTDNGLCDNRASGHALTDVNGDQAWNVTRSVEYGAVTGAKKIGDTNGDGVVDVTPALSAQPRYIIDAVKSTANHVCSGSTDCYRVTARAQGMNPNTVVVLQTIFKPF